MNVLIFEDEKHTAIRLKKLLSVIDESINVLAVIGSVKEGIDWLKTNPAPDLIFQDIMLNDGECFEIFNAVDITSPVIFTTAYSEYALKSFRVNSIDYIVKPYDKNDLIKALDRLKKMKSAFSPPDRELLKEILTEKTSVPKKRFLIKSGDNYMNINSSDVAYLLSEDSVTFAVLFTGKRYIVNNTITELSEQMDPDRFFRANRKFILNIESVKKISSWFNSRLKIKLNPIVNEDVIVSRERVKDFKKWLDR